MVPLACSFSIEINQFFQISIFSIGQIPSIHTRHLLSQSLEPFPENSGHKAGYSLDWMPVVNLDVWGKHACAPTKLRSQVYAHVKFRNMKFFGSNRKPDYYCMYHIVGLHSYNYYSTGVIILGIITRLFVNLETQMKLMFVCLFSRSPE